MGLAVVCTTLCPFCVQKVEQFNLTRSYDEAYQRGLEEERLKQTKINQDLEVAMFILQDTNDCLTTRLQAREEELVRDWVFSSSHLSLLVSIERRCDDVQLLLQALHWFPARARIDFKLSTVSHKSLTLLPAGFYGMQT